MNLKEHEKVLEELREQDSNIVFDGAVNNDLWADSKTRILWVLKETNEFPKDKDLRVLLREISNAPNPNSVYNRWKATYGLVVKVSHGLLNSLKWGEWADDVDTLVKNEKILEKIAVINVNKRAGAAKSDARKLKEAAEEFKATLLQQIELLDPHIIVLGGVGDIISEWIPEFAKGRKIIITDHPGQRSINHKEYYESIREEVSK